MIRKYINIISEAQIEPEAEELVDSLSDDMDETSVEEKEAVVPEDHIEEDQD